MREVPAITKAYGGEVKIEIRNATDITYNDPDLVQQMLPTLKRVAGEDNVQTQNAVTGRKISRTFKGKYPGFISF
jgi:amidohydrolase